MKAHREKERGYDLQVEAFRVKERDLDRREEALVGKGYQLRPREGLIEITELEGAIKARKKELRVVLKQLGEKKSLLARMLGG